LIALWSAVDRVGLSQGLFFQRKVGIEINLSGFDGLMAELKRNHGSIHSDLQQLHGSGVPQDMRRDSFLA